jgi:hypothetical protein
MVESIAKDPDCQEIAALFAHIPDAHTQLASASLYVGSTELSIKIEEPVVPISDEMARMKIYRESLQKHIVSTPPQSKSHSQPICLFTSHQKEQIKHLKSEVDIEERKRWEEAERIRLEEERRRQEEERRRLEAEQRRIEAENRKREEVAQRQREEQRLMKEINDIMNKFRNKRFASSQEARRFYMSIISGLSDEMIRRIGNRGFGWKCNAYDCIHDSPNECADPSQGGVWLIQ